MPRRRPSSRPPHREPPHHGHLSSELSYDNRPVRTGSAKTERHLADVAAAIAPFVRDPEDQTFVARCIASEGPQHHRLSSVALLRLAARALEAAGGADDAEVQRGRWVRFRLPPHLEREDDETSYPIRLPDRALDRLAPPNSREAAAYADALTDGPPHHALANVALVCILDALLARLERGNGA